MPEVNNTPAHPNDKPIECSKTRACGWQGMESDLASKPRIKGPKGGALQISDRVCPKCGCKTYYMRAAMSASKEGA